MATFDQVIWTNREHPNWTATEIAFSLGCSPEYVRATAKRKDLVLPRSVSRNATTIKQAAEYAEARARELEASVGSIKQVRTVPEPQLSKLKAQHWRIIGKWLRESATNG